MHRAGDAGFGQASHRICRAVVGVLHGHERAAAGAPFIGARRSPAAARFVPDSPLEGDGFELSVPRQKDSVFEAPSQNYQAVLLCRREVPAYFLFGTESEPPPNSQQKFLANWWFTGDDGGRMKQSTSFPVISFGTAAVTLYTSKNSPLGDLIGGNSDSDFTFLSVRGVYPAATMTVTFKSSGDK